jgi:hypothetical protein
MRVIAERRAGKRMPATDEQKTSGETASDETWIWFDWGVARMQGRALSRMLDRQKVVR